jgi:hypothetical protein
MIDILRYLLVVVVEGDWANDWLTHLDPSIAPTVMEFGKLIAQSIGG